MVNFETLVDELFDDLEAELEGETDFNEDVLRTKIKSAVREVALARKHPATYTDEMIIADVERYYPNIRRIALYDYNQIGVEGQHTHLENDTRREYVNRDSLFYGVTPIARI